MTQNNQNNKPHPLAVAVAGTVDREKMFQQGDRVLVGVSGGADSVVLLHILHQLAAGMGLHLGVAHLNHALRGKAADHDAPFSQGVGHLVLGADQRDGVDEVVGQRRDLFGDLSRFFAVLAFKFLRKNDQFYGILQCREFIS